MKKTKIAAMSDLHIGKLEFDYTESFKQLSQEAEILVLCGDLTDHGTEDEMKIVLQQLTYCTIPVITVLGNHDYESGRQKQIIQLLHEAKISVLDGTSCVQGDIGFAGIKGFCGGFNSFMLSPWGEKEIKDFVQTCINESLQLEKALSELQTDKKVVLLHYAPIVDTINGEPLEIYPYLGCSRLLPPIEQFKPDVVFHGHAHHGTLSAKTPQGVPVYNVSVAILEREKEKKQYILLEI